MIYTQAKDPWVNKLGPEFRTRDEERIMPAITNFFDIEPYRSLEDSSFSNYEKVKDMSLNEIPYLIDRIESLEDAPTQECL